MVYYAQRCAVRIVSMTARSGSNGVFLLIEAPKLSAIVSVREVGWSNIVGRSVVVTSYHLFPKWSASNKNLRMGAALHIDDMLR